MRTRDTAERVKQSGRQQLESGKDRAADQAERLADVVQRVGAESQRDGDGTIASYAGDLASGLERFADTLRHKSVNELASEVQTLARRNPALFIAGSIGVGFAIARFFKASSDAHRQQDSYGDRSVGFDEGGVDGTRDIDADLSGLEQTEYLANDTTSARAANLTGDTRVAAPSQVPGQSASIATPSSSATSSSSDKQV